MPNSDKYSIMERTLRNALHDLSILSGDIVGPSGASWQDVAGTAAVNLHALASLIEDIRKRGTTFIVFPSPEDCMPGSLTGKTGREN